MQSQSDKWFYCAECLRTVTCTREGNDFKCPAGHTIKIKPPKRRPPSKEHIYRPIE